MLVAAAVYAYTYEDARTDVAGHAMGVDKVDPGGGGTFYFHNVNQHFIAPPASGAHARSGTISVAVVRRQSDGGIVLHVAETPRSDDGATPVDCVVFGDTTVVCDPNRTLGPEASVLLGTLGDGFVDGSKLDAAGHWHVAPDSLTSADYRIAGSAGTQLDVRERASVAVPGSHDASTVEERIAYDSSRGLPTRIERKSTLQTLRGSITVTLTARTTLTLQSSNAPLPGVP